MNSYLSKLYYAEVKNVAKGPVIIGSGVTINNIESYLSSDAVIDHTLK